MSQLDRFLAFAFSHQTVIIEIIFAIMLGIVVVWLFSHLKQEDSNQGMTGADLSQIESVLKRVLENTTPRNSTAADAARLIQDEDSNQGPTSISTVNVTVAAKNSAQGAAGATQGQGALADTAEVARLKAESDAKAKKLSEVEKALGSAQGELEKLRSAATAAPGTAVNVDELNAKIKSLQARLAEYEIIEDDIANLSLYKEENTRLKTELDRLSKGAESAAADGQAAAGSAPSETPPTEATAAMTGDAAVPSAPTTAVPEAMVTTAPPADAAPVSPELVEAMGAAVAADTSAATGPAAAPLGGSPTGPDAKPIDSNKLLQEFDTLVAAGAQNPEQPQEKKDSSEKLIEEFENFMKGSGS
jgi:hypothetical protein